MDTINCNAIAVQPDAILYYRAFLSLLILYPIPHYRILIMKAITVNTDYVLLGRDNGNDQFPLKYVQLCLFR